MANKIHPEQKVFCPSCGAPIFFIEGREFTYCQYCGYQVYRPDPKLGMKLRHEENKMSLWFRHKEKDKSLDISHDVAKMEYQDRREERDKDDKDFDRAIAILAMFFFVLILLMLILCMT